MIHACCWSHARRGFIDAIKVQNKAQAPDAKLERIVALMDSLFSIDREAREQKLSLDDRHALRQERAPALLSELKSLLEEMKASGTILPKSVAGKAINYTLKRWVELTQFLDHSIIELSTNWAENSMRPIAIGRKNWLHLGSKEAGPKIAALFSIVESCRKLGPPYASTSPTCSPAWLIAPYNPSTNSPLRATPPRRKNSLSAYRRSRQPWGWSNGYRELVR